MDETAWQEHRTRPTTTSTAASSWTDPALLHHLVQQIVSCLVEPQTSAVLRNSAVTATTASMGQLGPCPAQMAPFHAALSPRIVHLARSHRPSQGPHPRRNRCGGSLSCTGSSKSSTHLAIIVQARAPTRGPPQNPPSIHTRSGRSPQAAPFLDRDSPSPSDESSQTASTSVHAL